MTKERTLTIEDIQNIRASELPLIVFSDNVRSFLGWAIRARTKGVYNHCMVMVSPGAFLSQDILFRQVPVERYLQGCHRLKLVGNRLWSNHTKRQLRAHAIESAQLPWWKRRYDLLGVAGQLFGLDSLNIPWLDYCSEKVTNIIRQADPMLVMKHPSPTDLNWYTKEGQKRGYYVYGRYAPD